MEKADQILVLAGPPAVIEPLADLHILLIGILIHGGR